jgi:hypothetical protein
MPGRGFLLLRQHDHSVTKIKTKGKGKEANTEVLFFFITDILLQKGSNFDSDQILVCHNIESQVL